MTFATRALIVIVCATISFRLHAQILDERVTTQSNIGLTLNNLGLIGNAFRGSYTQRGFPSCQYPVGSSIEHLFQGGIWVGAYRSARSKVLAPNGTDSVLVKSMLGPYVSTAAFDSPSGYTAGSSNFEFTAISGNLSERSSIPRSQVYSPQAISHQDYVTEFTDTNFAIPGSGNPPRLIPNHTNRLGLKVKLESYNWNFPFANFFVVLNYTITNVGKDTLDSLHVGQYYNAVVRNVARTTPVGTAFFNKGGNGFEDSLNMGYVFDAIGDPGYTESYIGIKFLGAEKLTGEQAGKIYLPGKIATDPFKVNFQTWLFGSSDPKFFPPPNDPERFSRMSRGLQHESNWSFAEPPGEPIRETIRKPGNRTNVLSCGNFQRLNPGESLSVVFTVVCAKKNDAEGLPNSLDTPTQRTNLLANALWAQTAYNGEDQNGNGILEPNEDANNNGRIDRYILPSPPDVPDTRIVARSNSVDVYWADNSENSIDPISKEKDFEGYKLYKSAFAFDMKPSIDLQRSFELVAEWDKAGNAVGYNTGFDNIRLAKDTVFEGDTTKYRYKYTIRNLQNGWQHAIALTAFDRGSAQNNLGPLESAQRSNQFLVFPGTPANQNPDDNKPFVYPDPYYGGAAWEGASTRPEDRKLYFANLPAKCEVQIFSLAGDLIDEFLHDATTYRGDEQWFKTYSTFTSDSRNPDTRIFSGGEHDWNLLSKNAQIISRGLYLFSVKDLKTGKFYNGKFTIIK